VALNSSGTTNRTRCERAVADRTASLPPAPARRCLSACPRELLLLNPSTTTACRGHAQAHCYIGAAFLLRTCSPTSSRSPLRHQHPPAANLLLATPLALLRPFSARPSTGERPRAAAASDPRRSTRSGAPAHDIRLSVCLPARSSLSSAGLLCLVCLIYPPHPSPLCRAAAPRSTIACSTRFFASYCLLLASSNFRLVVLQLCIEHCTLLHALRQPS
jgi:hypothetical protein